MRTWIEGSKYFIDTQEQLMKQQMWENIREYLPKRG